MMENKEEIKKEGGFGPPSKRASEAVVSGLGTAREVAWGIASLAGAAAVTAVCVRLAVGAVSGPSAPSPGEGGSPPPPGPPPPAPPAPPPPAPPPPAPEEPSALLGR